MTYPDRRLVDAESLAEYLGICRASVYNLLDRGLPSIKIGRSRRFRLTDVDEWLDADRKTA